jgi:hypothetical protein
MVGSFLPLIPVDGVLVSVYYIDEVAALIVVVHDTCLLVIYNCHSVLLLYSSEGLTSNDASLLIPDGFIRDKNVRPIWTSGSHEGRHDVNRAFFRSRKPLDFAVGCSSCGNGYVTDRHTAGGDGVSSYSGKLPRRFNSYKRNAGGVHKID